MNIDSKVDAEFISVYSQLSVYRFTVLNEGQFVSRNNLDVSNQNAMQVAALVPQYPWGWRD